MPIYEFLCEKCLNRFDKLAAGMNDTSPTACPKCNSTSTKKQISRFSAHAASDQTGGDEPCGMMPNGQCRRPGCGMTQ